MKKSKYIDHTILKADANIEDIKKLCSEAMEYDFKSVCVNPYWVSECANLLKGSDVLVCTVIGFPLGANTSSLKAFETKEAISNGAGEIDMVLNIGAMKSKQYDVVLNDIKAVVEAAGNTCVKVIIETCLLTEEEKIKACELSLEAKATFVKTSTGFSTGGATVEDVKLMKSIVKDELEVKASGGVRTLEDFNKMVESGATRIGTSNGINLMMNKDSDSNY